ncbi:MAG: hypothetical protein ACTHLW_09025 [Verrucomicrobiota bacterium]
MIQNPSDHPGGFFNFRGEIHLAFKGQVDDKFDEENQKRVHQRKEHPAEQPKKEPLPVRLHKRPQLAEKRDHWPQVCWRRGSKNQKYLRGLTAPSILSRYGQKLPEQFWPGEIVNAQTRA